MTGVVDSDPQPPGWLRWLGNDVAKIISGSRHETAPVGCHFFHDSLQDVWELTLFVMATEIVGGPADGTHLPSYFQIDLNAVIALFDSVPQVRWQASSFAEDDQLGCHISLEGEARGHDVWLRILQVPPPEFDPGRLYFADNGAFENLSS